MPANAIGAGIHKPQRLLDENERSFLCVDQTLDISLHRPRRARLPGRAARPAHALRRRPNVVEHNIQRNVYEKVDLAAQMGAQRKEQLSVQLGF
ncbi:MAG TPA: hypothetical protein PLT20_09220 [Sedimentisphaerales bacterium]|nr:hypothetical protein [Sedimentisphaerales bacterium]